MSVFLHEPVYKSIKKNRGNQPGELKLRWCFSLLNYGILRLSMFTNFPKCIQHSLWWIVMSNFPTFLKYSFFQDFISCSFFQILQCIHGVCHRWDQDDTTAPNLSVLQSKQNLSDPRYTQQSDGIGQCEITLLSTLARSYSGVLMSSRVLHLIVIIERFPGKLDYRSSQKCPWIYCSSEWFFNTKYDTHKIWPFENMI